MFQKIRSENGSYITGSVFFEGRCEQLRLNHYHTRSEEELRYKMCERGYSFLKDVSSDEWYRRYLHQLEYYNKLAVVYDPAIPRFIAPLRERLNALEN